MSRSWRKPFIKIGPSDKWREKRFANRRVRRRQGYIPEGNWYKKLYDPWNINDLRWFEYDNDRIKRK